MSNLLKTLKFVQGSVGKKDLVPAMTHFAIEKGTVRGWNGMISICSPIPINIDCQPKAKPLIDAIAKCGEGVSMTLTTAGKLHVQSGGFKAYVDCFPEEVMHLMPEGEIVLVDGESLLRAFKILEPFIGNDASRPWTNGILLRDQSAMATNNVIVIEYWLGVTVPFVANIPREAIKEIVRIAEPPSHVQIGERSLTVHYEDGKWIRTTTFETNWPDIRKAVFSYKPELVPMDERIFKGLEMIRPFADDGGRVFMDGHLLRTHMQEGVGSVYEIPDLVGSGLYRIEMLQLLEGVAQSIDWTKYPRACLFQGEKLRGAIIGLSR